ncbi:MAG: MFS transporter [Chloroflexi bacterium]|nr:MFS transporter [Chloroflexota bacterium]
MADTWLRHARWCGEAAVSAPLAGAGRATWLPALTPDGWLLFATAAVRTFAYGFLSVVLGLYLDALGLDAAAIGAVFTAALAGGAAMTIWLTAVADRLGRRRVLSAGAVLMGLAGAVFAVTDQPAVLMFAAILGTISPSGKEVGPFLSVEQAILPQTTPDAQRTSAFAAYNVVSSLAGALGALAAALPALLGLDGLAGYRLLVWAYAAAALVLLALFARLSSAAEAQQTKAAGARPRLGLHRSRGVVLRLAALFAVDSFAGGFVVQSLVAYWFYLRFGADMAALGLIFFGANVLAALSFFAAAPIARRIGLLNTMVFTHLPSNVLLMLVALMPSLELAAAMLLVRHLLSQLDVPTRQSYTMAVVAPDERSAAAGLTQVARTAAAAVAPGFTGAALAVPALGLPFVIAGALKIVYDLAILAAFRSLRPPEEKKPSTSSPAAAAAPAERRSGDGAPE